LLLLTFPVRGVAQAVIAWWYSQNLLVVWFSLVALAIVFYLLPKLTQRELHSHYLALFAYWMLILFAGWGGIPNSAPVPVWIPTLSTIGSVLFLLSVIAVALNVCETAGCSLKAARGKPLAAFLLFGVAAFVFAALLRAGIALLDTDQTLQLTWFGPALSQLNCYGFFVMVMFGALYFIMPRLVGIDFPWPKLVRAHFWIATIGVVLLVVPLLLGGLMEEFKLQNASQPFLLVTRSTLPFLRVSTIGDLLLLIGHLFFLTNLVGLTLGFYRARAAAAYAQLTADLFKTAGAKA
jgi:cytochrome c oxidase cbb3-type subunit 1